MAWIENLAKNLHIFLIIQVRVLGEGGGGYAYMNVLMEHLYNSSNVMITKYTMIFKCKIVVHYIK